MFLLASWLPKFDVAIDLFVGQIDLWAIRNDQWELHFLGARLLALHEHLLIPFNTNSRTVHPLAVASAFSSR
jgi:hypothetical protein